MEYLIKNINCDNESQIKIKVYNHPLEELNNKKGYLISNDKKGNCIIKIDNKYYKVKFDRIKLIK